jgi:putative peptidoglycan lipid II flippase
MKTEPVSSEKREIGRASAILAFFTLVSRVLGLARNQILSHFFGATFVADAFIAAFTIPNALRRLFGEGALTPAIVSLFTRSLREPPTEDGSLPWQGFISAAFAWLSICLSVLCILGILLSPWIVQIYVPDFSNTPGKMELTVKLTQFLFPFIIFIGWSAFFMGILNTFRSFAISAFVPALLSISVVLIVPVSLKILFPGTTHGIYFYAGALLIGGIGQAALQLPDLKRFKALPLYRFRWADPRVKELAKLLIPSFFSMATYQLNIIVNRTFASSIPGAVSHLFYADLILELPVALVATSVGTAVIPSFSRLLTDQKREELAEAFQFALEAIWTLAIPCTLGLIVLAGPTISTLYFSGKFTLLDSRTTASVLIFYAFGLPFFATMRIFLAFFFASKNTLLPFIASCVALVANFVCAYSLSRLMSVSGIALATSISSFVNISILAIFVARHHPEFRWLEIARNFFKIFLASLLMGLILYFVQDLVAQNLWDGSGITKTKIITLSALVGLGAVTYFLAAVLFRVPHAETILKKWGGRLMGKR